MPKRNGTETAPDGEISFEESQQWQLNVLSQKEEECRLLQELDKIHGGPSRTDLNGELRCPRAWDSLYCWEAANAGEIVSAPCPEYVFMFNRSEEVSRYCTENGTWFVHPGTNKPWSNYSMCLGGKVVNSDGEAMQDSLIMEWLPIIKTISQVGYSLSMCTLIIAFLILISIKKLRCPRNTLHVNLFLSFMLRAFMALLKDSLFIDGIGLPQSIVDGTIFSAEKSNWECKLVTTLWQYFIVANYSWILMEGLYLHNLIFLAPFSDSSAITLYVLLGWGLPIPVIISWVVCRINFDDSLCWTTHHNNANLFLIVRIPIIVTIVLNFLFFVNITRVLLVKLQSAVSIETRKYRKWAKSTLVLVPLFGVHYMLFVGMSYYWGINPLIEVIWLFCDQLFASFQGFCVAILYCLLNGEVRSEITKKWRGWRSESESKNVWVPLHHITSRFNHHRSTQEMGMSGTSMAGVLSNCTAAVKQPLTAADNTNPRRLDREFTEEHQIEITQGD
ncbi:parathyroid hormone/parathyroid hormone-related peptide receptor isoform X2 [Folsomia candida]|uniref:parathyroid hormone/parathyroid hormone-related peptide receptor isoform X2 n=1 Tax=Folsomia candida TaxID=158441 RepID=UPI0016051C9B|nr:parathyroid hormone/parathyroid hormone-related peptide receptor isoform X2 [Folsomia candida]